MAGAGAPPEAAAKGEAGAVPGTSEDGEPLDTPRPAESERSVGGPVSDERRAEAVQQRPEAERSASRSALLLLLLAAATAAACSAAGLAVHAQRQRERALRHELDGARRGRAAAERAHRAALEELEALRRAAAGCEPAARAPKPGAPEIRQRRSRPEGARAAPSRPEACDPECRDATKACPAWAGTGGCETNAAFMASSCRAACGLCVPCDAAAVPLPSAKGEEGEGQREEALPPLPASEPFHGHRPLVFRENSFYVFDPRRLGPECDLHDKCYHAEKWVMEFLQARGLQRVEFWQEAQFVWTFMGDFTFSMKRDTQMVNHVANLGALLGAKSHLHATLAAHAGPRGCDLDAFVPRTYFMEDEPACEALRAEVRATERKWILKPPQGSGGHGIKLVESSAELDRHLTASDGSSRCASLEGLSATVAQRYVPTPLLVPSLGRRKFNVRLMALVASVDPLLAFVHRDGYMGHSTQAFDLGAVDEAVHLTGLHSQESLKEYHAENRTVNWDDFAAVIDRDYPEFGPGGADPAKRGGFRAWFQRQVKGLMTFVLEAAAPRLERHPHSFNPLAIDLLVDERFQLWLLEVNPHPFMSYESEWGRRWMRGVVEEMLDIQLEVYRKKEAGEPLREIAAADKWEPIINTSGGEAGEGFSFLGARGPCYGPEWT